MKRVKLTQWELITKMRTKAVAEGRDQVIEVVNGIFAREIARVEKIMQDFPKSQAVNLIHVNAEYELIRTEIVDAVAKIDSAAKRNAEIDIKVTQQIKEAEPTVAQRNTASKLIMENNHDR